MRFKKRPCVIVSPDELNCSLQTAIVAPLTSGRQPPSFHIPVRSFNVSGLIVPDQMRALDRTRMIKRLGEVDQVTLNALLDVLAAMFAH